MAEHQHPLADIDLDRALTDLGRRVAFPPAPDLTRSVRARIVTRPRRPSRVDSWRVHLLPPSRVLAAAALVLLLLTGTLLALIPDARTAVADRLGLRGVRIVFVDEQPATTPAAPPVGAGLLLGERMSRAEAQARVPFPIQVPTLEELGQPDEIYVRELSGGPMVSLLYQPRPGLPEAVETGVGMLLMQFPGDETVTSLIKGIASEGGSMWPISIDGQPGFWISSTSSLVISPDLSVGLDRQEGRPSANVLFWERHGLTFRLESALVEGEAIQIAESLRTWENAPPMQAPTATLTPDAPPVTPVPAEDGVTVVLDELNDSGTSGTAVLTEVNGQTIVTLDLVGATGSHPAHIHEGTCDALDPNPIYPLRDIDADGTSTTVVTALRDLTAGNFAINVHDSPANIGLYIACGNIPQS